MKRFYTDVTISQDPNGYAILLDGKPIKTPSQKLLVVPSEALAEGIAQEWRAQGEKVELASMYLTRMAYGVVELEEADRAMLREESVAYITTELLCYHDGQQPELLAQQQAQWGAVLVWAEEALGMPLVVTTGILPVTQPEQSVQRAQALVDGLRDGQLVPFALIVRVLGSLVLACAVLEKHVDISEAVRLSRLEQHYQYAKWGEDMAVMARLKLAAAEAEAASRFMFLT